MAIPLPRGRVRAAFSNPGLYDFPIAVGGGASARTAAYRFFADGATGWGWSYVAVGFVLVVAGLGKAYFAFRKHARTEDLHELHGCLLTLYHTICGDSDCKAARLRITVHVASPDERTLQQVLDYVGDSRGGKTAGRIFPVQSGITGKAFRERQVYVAKCAATSHDDYVNELVRDWHYTEPDARQRQPDTRSWFALPIQVSMDGGVLGVLYLDSVLPEFFDNETRVNVIAHAAVGIAFFVGKRYSSNQEEAT